MREKQKQQAVLRMRKLKLSKNVIDDFIENGTIYYSERQNAFFDGILYWLKNENHFVKIVKDFESRAGSLVYHAQLLHTEFGDLLTLLYVSKHESEWEQDIKDLSNEQALAYVRNVNDDLSSEFGYVGIKPKNGGVSRTW